MLIVNMQSITQAIPTLVAHRGYSRAYPENTLIAIKKALEFGACYVEFDVQISRDGIPVIMHDVELVRTTGREGNVNELPVHELVTISAGEPERFGDTFINEKIPLLAAVVELLKLWPARQVFLEIKRSSIRHFGAQHVMQCIKPIIEPVLRQVIIISFDAEVLRCARSMGCTVIGWVFDQWRDQALNTANLLQPDYVFVDWECVPDEIQELSFSTKDTKNTKGTEGHSNNASNNSQPLNDSTNLNAVHQILPAHWQWVVYEIDDAQLALDWATKGAALVETNAIGDLVRHPLLNKKCCRD